MFADSVLETAPRNASWSCSDKSVELSPTKVNEVLTTTTEGAHESVLVKTRMQSLGDGAVEELSALRQLRDDVQVRASRNAIGNRIV